MRWVATRILAALRWPVFLGWLAAALLATWYGLGVSARRFEAIAGRPFVDLQPGLTPEALREQVAAYPAEAVDYYLRWSVFDFAWPFVAYTAMLFVTAWLLRRAGRTGWLPLLVGVAYATVLMDWSENIGFASLAAAPAGEPAWLASVAVYCHRAKLVLNVVFNAGFGVAFAAAVWRRVRPPTVSAAPPHRSRPR
jgi:hypothetical protein